jgi:hypothetical protein
MKKIIFITTYKARDFEGQGLVGWYLKSNYGIDSYFINGYDIYKKVLEIKPAVLVMDHLVWDHKKSLAKWASGLGIKVVLLFTEGYYHEKSGLDKMMGEPVSTKLGIESYFVWNYSMTERAKEIIKDSKFLHRFKVTGCPRFDFLINDKLKLIIEQEQDFKVKYQVESYSTIVTYMSTTPYQGYPFQKFYKRYRKRAKYSEEEIKSFYFDQQQQFKNHAEIIRETAIRNPDCFFFYKTHPSESYITNCNAAFENVKNIKVIVNENVRPFLFYSDLIVQRNCTTAIESWLLGKPVVQLDDYNYTNQPYPEHNEYSYIIKNSDELDLFIKSNQYKKWDPLKVESFLENIFYKLDGKAYIRVGDEIFKIMDRFDLNDQLELNKKIALYQEKIDLKWINQLKDILGIPRKNTLRPGFYFKKMINRNKPKPNTDNEVSIPDDEVIDFYKKIDGLHL